MSPTSRLPFWNPDHRSNTAAGPAAPAPLQPDLRVGTELAGYRLHELVGRGGMGVVYRAEHLHLGRIAALKLLAPDVAADPAFRERFVRESRLAASIQHPNIVTVYDADEADGLLFTAMQYVNGTDLGALLARVGVLEPAQALSILSQVASALEAAHGLGMVHRDVKPANVLIDEERSYLTDFGLTRRVSSVTTLTAHGQFVGTVDYVSPEQIRGAKLYGRSDLYALGCLLFHVLTGSLPFETDGHLSAIYAHLEQPPPSLSARRPNLPPALDAVIARALAKRPEERYERCTELIAAARDALSGDAPPSAQPLVVLPRKRAGTILIADDDAAVRATIRGILGAERFAYLEAASTDQALTLAHERRPDLVLLDWELPGTPAEELTRALRAGGGADRTRIMVLASRVRAPERGTIVEAGADDLLLRPFSSLQLKFKVGEVLGARALAGD